jgi:hypothetical protein
LPTHPFDDLCCGKLPMDHMRDYCVEQSWWNGSLVLSGTIMTLLLLERCPDATVDATPKLSARR